MNSGNDNAEAEFAEFTSAGDVEVGDSNKASDTPEQKSTEETANKGGDDGDENEAEAPENNGEQGDAEGDDGEEDEKPKKTKTPSERIRELNKRLRQEERLRLASDERLAALEAASKKGGLQDRNDGGNSTDDIGNAPDPSDQEKYPLGHLDDRYIEDKLEWLTTKKAAERADAVLQRQQESERAQAAERSQKALLDKVDDLATRGSELFDDFHESVVETGMKGDWPLTQTTFEAAHESPNGAQILYDLSRDKAEAKRVAELSPLQQLRYVDAKNAEIEKKKQARKIPQAGDPPRTQTRGASSKVQINPATDNLDDFEKAWEAGARRN